MQANENVQPITRSGWAALWYHTHTARQAAIEHYIARLAELPLTEDDAWNLIARAQDAEHNDPKEPTR